MKTLPTIFIRTPLLPFNYKEIDPIFIEALYIASPDLYNEYLKFISGAIIEPKEINKLKISLYKYLKRATTRCTPFGLFAGVNIGELGSENKVSINGNIENIFRRKTRLDMNVVCAIAQEVSKQEFIQPHLKYYPNNSIYQLDDFYRYVEYYYLNTKRIHKICKVDFSEYLQLVFQEAKFGKKIDELIQLLISPEISKEEATAFISELVNSQLLISELEPTVTGKEFFEVIIDSLQSVNLTLQSKNIYDIINLLLDVQNQINQLDISVINDISSYKLIFEKIKGILPSITEVNLFQTDLFKYPKKSVIDIQISKSIEGAIRFLNKITPNHENNNLNDFKNKFREKYEEAEIPLLQALDNEIGIGYLNKESQGINDLVDDIFILSEATESKIKWDSLQASLNHLLVKSIKENKSCIEISENDFSGMDFSSDSLPTSIAVMFKILNGSTNKILISNIGGSSAINLLGRFAHGNVEILDTIKSITHIEQQDDATCILAEIVHLPESRAGNILARPIFRQYEIPYLAKSAVKEEFQIDVSDLYVSLKEDKILLRSKRLNKQIVPRLGNAHNFSFNALPVYQFLCDLQIQHFRKPFLSFNWGVLSNQYSFLPRVEYKNIVLSPARWQLRKSDFDFLLKKQISDAEKAKLFDEFRLRNKLPDTFLIVDGDNDLLIDSKDSIAINVFVDALKNRQNIILEEFLFDSEHALVKGIDDKAFTNECIAVILNEKEKKPEIILEKGGEMIPQRRFFIGSEWLYFKIYSGVKMADYILTEKVKGITENLLERKMIDKWFFIRYADPDTHLRLRLHVIDNSKYGEILSILNNELQNLVNKNLIIKIQTDTYDRELNRYGYNTIELAEKLFYYDSVCCTNILSLLDPNQGSTIRWQISLRATDQLLDDFGLSVEEKYNFMAILSKSFFTEHGGKKELKFQLDDKYRKVRLEVERILNRELDSEREIYPLIKFLDEKGIHVRLIANEINEIRQLNLLEVNYFELLSSYVHMMLNRLFMAKQRTNEFVVYDILARNYKSILARDRKLVKM